jgi:hypothetical protein
MKRHLGIALVVLLIAAVGFGGGYWYRHSHPPMQAEMEDYALANILSEVGYAHYIAKGNLTDARKIIDINLNGHLSHVLRYQGSITDETFMASKIRALNAVANLWEVHPPFAGMEAESADQFWWQGWRDMTAKNRELLDWARAQCALQPALKCASPNSAVERDAREPARAPHRER